MQNCTEHSYEIHRLTSSHSYVADFERLNGGTFSGFLAVYSIISDLTTEGNVSHRQKH